MPAPRPPTRREVLRVAAGAAGLAALGCGGDGSPRRRRVGIVGGGMAGIATAWLLEGAYDVVLFEARDALGGNARTLEIDVNGRGVPIDLGAQYFHPGPHPTYVRLLEHLGVSRPDAPDDDGVHELASTITIAAEGEALPRFVSPVSPDRDWAITADWNQAGLGAFLTLARAAGSLEREGGDWDVTVDDFLRTLDLDETQRDGILLPWIASLYSGDLEQARGYSARSALTFLSRALGGDPLAPIEYHTLTRGMGAIIETLAAEASGATVHLSAPVDALSREGGRFRLAAGARAETVDLVVFAAPPFVAAPLLEALPGAAAQRAALEAIAFHDAELVLHADPTYAPADPAHWSFFNAGVAGGFCEGSMWLAPAVAPLEGAPLDLWKSWVTHRDFDPTEPLASASFRHMLPTPASLAAQRALSLLQGEGGLYFAGGTTREVDSQETALRSAMDVAAALDPGGARLAALLG